MQGPEHGDAGARASTSTTARQERYLPALDGLRAVAVAAVLAYHLGRVRGGFLGVDLFFVISGYLITSLLLGEARSTGTVSLRAFWVRRFRRLLPALLLVLIAVVVAGQAWLPSWRLGGLRTDALATLGYVANWRFIASGQSYFTSGIGPTPLRHAWSLGIEEQFYVVWPILVLLALRFGRPRVRGAVALVAGVGAAVSITWMVHLAGGGRDLSRAYYGTDSRAFTLLVGVLLAVALAPGPARRVANRGARLRGAAAVLGLPALVVAGVFVRVAANDARWMYRGGFVAFAMIAATLVAAATGERGPFVRLLSARPLRWVGRVSYGIYLWSWPVQIFAQTRFHLHGWRLDLAVVATTVTAAALSAALIERPIREGRLFGARSEPIRLAGPPAAVAIAAWVVIVATAGATPVPALFTVSDRRATAEALRPASKPVPRPPITLPTTTAVPTGPGVPSTAPPTTLPATLGRPVQVMITGDSVGWSLGWGLNGPSIRDGVLDDRALIGCGIMPQSQSRWITAASPDPQTYYPDCDRQQEAERLGLEGRPDAVLLSVGTWEIYDQDFAGRRWNVGSRDYARLLTGLLQQRIDRYRAAGAVTVITLVPCFGDMAPRLGSERRDPHRVRWLNGVLRHLARANKQDVISVDPAEVLCENGTSRGDLPGIGPLRPDGVHYTVPSARWLWETWLTPKIVRLVVAKAAASAPGAPPSTVRPPGP
ncbi:MAG: putative O-acetyltransferase [Acidimicrobiales bacterium]|nr:putative O-acetyltransferase [Acidimicrobiales bacterium]